MRVHPSLLVASLVVLVVFASPRPAPAQTVHGTLVNEDGGAPLPHGAVSLFDASGVKVDSTRAGADGAFTLHATSPGTFTLYFTHPGYASVPSAPIALKAGDTVEKRFAVPLIGGAAMERMAEVVDLEKRLQGDIVELCGERPRSWEAGILVGVVRTKDGGAPLAGAVVRIEAPARAGGEPFHRATVSSANGVYVICNVPEGRATMRTTLEGYRVDEGPVDAHAGDVGWYDVYLGRARSRR